MSNKGERRMRVEDVHVVSIPQTEQVSWTAEGDSVLQ